MKKMIFVIFAFLFLNYNVLHADNISFAWGSEIPPYSKINYDSGPSVAPQMLCSVLARNLRFVSFIVEENADFYAEESQKNITGANIYKTISNFCTLASSGLEIVIYQYNDSSAQQFTEMLKFSRSKPMHGLQAERDALIFVDYDKKTQEYIVNIWHDPLDWTVEKSKPVIVRFSQEEIITEEACEFIAIGRYFERLFIKLPPEIDSKKPFCVNFKLSVQMSVDPFYAIVPLASNKREKFKNISLSVRDKKHDLHTCIKSVCITLNAEKLKLLEVAPIATYQVVFPLYFPNMKGNSGQQHEFDLYIPVAVIPTTGAIQFIFGYFKDEEKIFSVKISPSPLNHGK